jgi:hypothetical protein
LTGESLLLPQQQKKAGHIEVRTHLWVTDGIELQVSAETAGLSPEELRHFLKGVLSVYEQIKKDKQ